MSEMAESSRLITLLTIDYTALICTDLQSGV